MKTGEGLVLRDHVCRRCGELKPCLEGSLIVNDRPPVAIYTCPGCFDKETAEYNARLKEFRGAEVIG